jgi:hypothetical protein
VGKTLCLTAPSVASVGLLKGDAEFTGDTRDPALRLKSGSARDEAARVDDGKIDSE